MILNALVHRLPEIIDSPKFEPFKSEHFEKWFPIYQELELENWPGTGHKMSQGNMGMWQDRTRTIPHYLNMSGWEPLPERDSSFSKTFKQICLETAEEIVKRANGDRINISWSGGLDSTCAFFSLREFAAPGQLKIFCNYNSIVESGTLFDTYIKDQVDYSITLPMSNPQFSSGLIVTGMLSDQLFGRYQAISPQQFNVSWKDYLTPKQVELVEQILPNWPGTEIKTVPDFLSFIELNCKWQMGKFNRVRNIPKHIASRVINFYEPQDFQRWSLGNYEPKWYNEDIKTYKWVIRTILQDFMKPGDPFPMNKVVQSSHYHIIEHSWVMMLADGSHLYLKDFK